MFLKKYFPFIFAKLKLRQTTKSLPEITKESQKNNIRFY